MKKIEAIIDPVKVNQVKKALLDVGIRRIETTEVKGFGRHDSHAEVYRGRGYTVDYTREVKIEIVLQDAQLESATAILLEAAGLGDDDTFLIFPVETPLQHATAGKSA